MKKLKLNVEHLRKLTETELKDAVGGTSGGCTNGCSQACPTPGCYPTGTGSVGTKSGLAGSSIC